MYCINRISYVCFHGQSFGSIVAPSGESQHRHIKDASMSQVANVSWAVKKAQEKKLDVGEMRMSRWTSGVTKLDRIKIQRITRHKELS